MLHKAGAMMSAIIGITLMNCVRATTPKPHIVFIMADDLGFNDVSYHGNGEIPTPNIDALAANGLRLENYYVGPTCGPTRAQFLTGKYTIHMGLHNSNLDSCTKDAPPLTDQTIADALKGEGYATHLIGKWHAGYHTANHLPTNRGFDTFRGFLLSHGDHFAHDARFLPTGIDYVDYRDNADPYAADIGVYSTTAFTNRAKDLISTHNTSTPMFMYLSYQAAHSPNQYPAGTPTDRSITVGKRRKYAAMVTVLDAAIKEVVDSLTAAGMYDNTVIIFSSDNGGTNENGGSNYPLRGQKGGYYQGGVRAVGIVSSPLLDASQVGQQSTDLIHITDWLPTMLGIAGYTGGSLSIDGFNQWNSIKSAAVSPRTEVVLNIGRKVSGSVTDPFDESVTAAMIDGDYKILTGNQNDLAYPNPSADYAAWNLVRSSKTFSSTTKLFNITDDPYEDTDLSGTHTAEVTTLLAKLRAYQVNMITAIADEKDGVACDPANLGGYWGPWTV